MRELNRSAVIVLPKQPFLQWLQSIDSSSARLTLKDLRHEPAIYLVPECESEREFADCLLDLFPAIFEDQLSGWWTEPSSWPVKRTTALFKAWFECRQHSLVFDLCEDPLESC